MLMDMIRSLDNLDTNQWKHLYWSEFISAKNKQTRKQQQQQQQKSIPY